jgi:hypothetical protein
MDDPLGGWELGVGARPDGKRLLIFAMPEAPPGSKASVHVTMLLNFFEEVKRRVR